MHIGERADHLLGAMAGVLLSVTIRYYLAVSERNIYLCEVIAMRSFVRAKVMVPARPRV